VQSVTRLNAFKRNQQKFSMVTCYDYWSAQLIAASDIDSILVGDSLAVVMHGFPSTCACHPRAYVAARGSGCPRRWR
jgi:ketopantoate hydroxymethyltransferase